jgi:hypothetical protein
MKMKKILVAVLFILFASSYSYADWSITVSWTHSNSPYATKEKVFVGQDEICSVDIGNTAVCNFQKTDAEAEALRGQIVSIVSYNDIGLESNPLNVGSFDPPKAPSSPTGGAILYQYVK